MKITLNGKQVTIPDAISISDLLKKYGLEPETIVTEINRSIIPKAKYSTMVLNNEDRVEIVHIVGGG
ncbi:MAG: sulfur carrier protein ThiS [Chitinispirillia bacterium]|jgi:thiamine biosynthesis protein ThiS